MRAVLVWLRDATVGSALMILLIWGFIRDPIETAAVQGGLCGAALATYALLHRRFANRNAKPS